VELDRFAGDSNVKCVSRRDRGKIGAHAYCQALAKHHKVLLFIAF
jgi:hypothetical protein